MAGSRVIDKDMGYESFKRLLVAAQRIVVTVGPRGAAAQYGTYNEFGVPSKNIPSRPFMRSTLDNNKKELARDLKRNIMRLAVARQSNPFPAFETTGIKLEGMIKKAIRNWKEPPNKPSTVRKKGANNPLVDTGALMASVSYQVVSRRR